MHFEQAIRLQPRDPEINNAYGLFLCSQNRGREGIDRLMIAARDPLYPNPDYAYTNAGMCALWLNDAKSAEDYLRRAVIANLARTPRPCICSRWPNYRPKNLTRPSNWSMK